jgi:hypothetical protein
VKRLLLAIATLTFAIVFAQAQGQSEQPQPSAICYPAWKTQSPTWNEADFAIVRQKCRPGDIIDIMSTLNIRDAFVIAKLCDFSKAIIKAEGGTLCVLVGERGLRQ